MAHTVKSYVIRRSKMTPGQKNALNSLWLKYGLNYAGSKINLDNVFQRSAKKILEIGFGNGDSLLTTAQNYPHYDCVGIEVHLPGVGALLSKLEKHNVTNVKVFASDAVEVLQNVIADNTFDRIHIFFPDPWPKKRHHKRRLIQSDFVNLATTKLKSEGVLHLATDWKDYAEQMISVLSAEKNLINENNDFATHSEFRPLTKFELRGIKLGHKIYDLIFRKKGDSDAKK